MLSSPRMRLSGSTALLVLGVVVLLIGCYGYVAPFDVKRSVKYSDKLFTIEVLNLGSFGSLPASVLYSPRVRAVHYLGCQIYPSTYGG